MIQKLKIKNKKLTKRGYNNNYTYNTNVSIIKNKYE